MVEKEQDEKQEEDENEEEEEKEKTREDEGRRSRRKGSKKRGIGARQEEKCDLTTFNCSFKCNPVAHFLILSSLALFLCISGVAVAVAQKRCSFPLLTLSRIRAEGCNQWLSVDRSQPHNVVWFKMVLYKCGWMTRAPFCAV